MLRTLNELENYIGDNWTSRGMRKTFRSETIKDKIEKSDLMKSQTKTLLESKKAN